MEPLRLLTAAVLSGTLEDGRPYALKPDLRAAVDLRLHDGELRFLTAGGVLGSIDREAMTLADVVIPDVPFRGFVHDAPGWWVFDAQHRVVALDASGQVDHVVADYPHDVRGAWWDGGHLHVVTQARRHERGGLWRRVRRNGQGMRWWTDHRSRRIHDSTVWHVRDGELWWGENLGEFAGRLGVGHRRKPLRTDLHGHGFVELEGGLVAYGGLDHRSVGEGAWARLPDGAVHRTEDRDAPRRSTPTHASASALAWYGTVGGRPSVLDSGGRLFREAWADAPFERVLGPWEHRPESPVRWALDGDTTWLTDGRHGVLRVSADRIEPVPIATPSSSRDLRIRDGEVWLLHRERAWRGQGPPWRSDTEWRSHQAAAPDAARPYVVAVATSSEGPLWQVRDLDSDGTWLATEEEAIPTATPDGPLPEQPPVDPWTRLTPSDRADLTQHCTSLADGLQEAKTDTLDDRRHARLRLCAIDEAGKVWRGGETLEHWTGVAFEPVEGLPELGAIYAVQPIEGGIAVSCAAGLLGLGPVPGWAP